MNNGFDFDNFDIYEFTQEEDYDDSFPIEWDGPSIYPDPFLIATVTCLACLLIFGLLTKLTIRIFGTVTEGNIFTQTSNNNSGNNQTVLSSSNHSQNGVQNWDGNCDVNSRYPQKITQWCDLITKYSLKYNLDPDLIAALIWLESGGNELAYSHSGAVGLMQIMPRDGLASSFMCANGPCFKDRPSTDELRNPENNIAFGTRFLSNLIHRNGNLRDALKSYGPMDAGYTYSDKVLSIFNRYNSD
jgi:hypothetical protein